MNLREGRIGKQEAACTAAIAALISGMFSLNTQSAYQKGNSLYLSTILAALLSLAVFLFAADAMRRCGARELSGLFRMAFGRFFGRVAGVLTALSLLAAASLPLMRMLLILCRYIFVETEIPHVAAYFIPCLIVLTWFGFETLARTGKLFFVVTVLSFITVFWIASPAFETYRLFPLLGNGIPDMLWGAVRGMSRFLPALAALLICGEGVQGVDNASAAGCRAAVGGGVGAAASQVLLGMTYSYDELSGMHSPMYRLTMAVRTGSTYIRTDKVLLFFWTAASLLTSAFYTYAASLLYCRSASLRDIRPAVLCGAAAVAALTLVSHMNFKWFETGAEILLQFLWAALLIPLLLAGLLARIRAGRKRA